MNVSDIRTREYNNHIYTSRKIQQLIDTEPKIPDAASRKDNGTGSSSPAKARNENMTRYNC